MVVLEEPGPANQAAVVRTMGRIQGMTFSPQEQPEIPNPTSEDELQELIEALKTPPEALIALMQRAIELIQNNEKELKELRKDAESQSA